MTSRAGERFERLVEVTRTLRAPGGCPWDHEQTLLTLRPFVLEETYEVLDAIDRGDAADLKEEIGDFLYEAVFLAQIASDEGHFDIADSLDAIVNKLIRRHPHVFARDSRDGQDQPATADQVMERWEVLKARERAASGAAEGPTGALAGIPRSMPALLRAYKLGARAAAVGFDWTRPPDVMAKIEEEVAELREAVASDDAPAESAHVEEEMGDLLFAIANLSRKLGVEPEAALRRANDKFAGRFADMEQAVIARGQALSQLSLEEMEAEWQEVKGIRTED